MPLEEKLSNNLKNQSNMNKKKLSNKLLINKLNKLNNQSSKLKYNNLNMFMFNNQFCNLLWLDNNLL